MQAIDQLQRATHRFWLRVAVLGAVLAAGLGAAHYMEVHGHVVTGMNNRIVWGVPHVFAIFLIVAASGVLNVASIGSVFGQAPYKARAPLSALLCGALLAGGLMVLMLDLGRPDRVIVAATHYNFTSVFAWNVFLYSGMFGVVALYLWTLMERRMQPHSKRVGILALGWRLVLTSGTGAIFGFLVARQAYGSALLPLLFILLSFAWGLAVFLLVQAVICRDEARAVPDEVLDRMRRLLGVFVAAAVYFTLLYYVTGAYFAKQDPFVRFLLVDGGVYPLLFWGGYVIAGGLVPLALLFHPGLRSGRATAAAAALVVAGAFAFLYVFIIGGQAFPLEIFPGYAVSSSAADGVIAPYAPRLPELLLGMGGVAAALLLTVVGLRVLPFAPVDEAPAAHAKAGA